MHQVNLVLTDIAEDLNDAGPIPADGVVHPQASLDLIRSCGTVENYTEDEAVLQRLGSALCLV
jgi:hypothetical protein